MHMILAVTEIHDATLNSCAVPSKWIENSKHWDRATRMLRKKISQPIQPSERDALWLAVTIQSIAYVAAVAETSTPAEAWPLRPSSPHDLSWLKICTGKRLVTSLTDPQRGDGAFRLAATELQATMDYVKRAAVCRACLSSLPCGFYDLFDLSSDAKTNPYYAGVICLVELLALELDQSNFLPHLSWLCVLDDRFRRLLYQKDERAMLLLLYWYAKICDRRLWWMWRLSWTEGLAISIYLAEAWAEQPDMLKMLEWPRESLVIASSCHNINFY